MIKKYGAKILKSIKFIVALILMLTTIMFLCSCNIDPQNLDVWYLDGLIVDGQTYGVRDIYGTEYITSEYMTMAFKDGKVVFNKNGKIINGTYTYKDNIGCGTEKYDNNEVVVKLENGVTYPDVCFARLADVGCDEVFIGDVPNTGYFGVLNLT